MNLNLVLVILAHVECVSMVLNKKMLENEIENIEKSSSSDLIITI